MSAAPAIASIAASIAGTGEARSGSSARSKYASNRLQVASTTAPRTDSWTADRRSARSSPTVESRSRESNGVER